MLTPAQVSLHQPRTLVDTAAVAFCYTAVMCRRSVKQAVTLSHGCPKVIRISRATSQGAHILRLVAAVPRHPHPLGHHVIQLPYRTQHVPTHPVRVLGFDSLVDLVTP